MNDIPADRTESRPRRPAFGPQSRPRDLIQARDHRRERALPPPTFPSLGLRYLGDVARYERSNRPAAGAPPGQGDRPTVRMRRGGDGRYQPVEPEQELTPDTRAEEPPPEADDPRPAMWRNAAPDGTGTG